MKDLITLAATRLIAGHIPRQLDFDEKNIIKHIHNFYKLNILKNKNDVFFSIDGNQNINWFMNYVISRLHSYHDLILINLNQLGLVIKANQDIPIKNFITEDFENCPELTLIIPLESDIEINFTYDSGRHKNQTGKSTVPKNKFFIISSDINMKITSKEDNTCLICNLQYDIR
jgi:hypothetical protein